MIPSPTLITGAIGAAVALGLGIWIGVLELQAADLETKVATYKGQVDLAAKDILQATADVKACVAVNANNQAAIAREKASSADTLARVTADYERRMAEAVAVAKQRGTIDANIAKCPAIGGVPASIRGVLDWLRGTAPTAATPAAGNNHP